MRALPICDKCGKAVLVDGICPKCSGPLVEVEITTEPPEPEDPPTECERCLERLVGRTLGIRIGDPNAIHWTTLADLLGFEAPEEVAPSVLVSSARHRVRRIAALEERLADVRHHFETLALQLDQGDTVGARQRLAEVLHG